MGARDVVVECAARRECLWCVCVPLHNSALKGPPVASLVSRRPNGGPVAWGTLRPVAPLVAQGYSDLLTWLCVLFVFMCFLFNRVCLSKLCMIITYAQG